MYNTTDNFTLKFNFAHIFEMRKYYLGKSNNDPKNKKSYTFSQTC